MKYFFILILFVTFLSDAKSNGNEWTWSYKKKFSLNDSKANSEKKSLIFSKVAVPKYNQLIFSWNSYRPKKGYYSFYVQPRNSITKKWGDWYKMIDWGKNTQKSYSKIIDGEVSYHFVRLEMPKDKFSDGFKIKIESNNGADLSNLKMINVCISDFSKFEIQPIDKKILNLPSVEIKGIPKKSQIVLDHIHNRRMCSPTSTSMLLSYLIKKDIDPIEFAMKVFDVGLDAYGSWPFNTAHAFEKSPNFFFRVIRLNSFKELHTYLTNRVPIVVSVRGKLNGAPQEYSSGHLVLVSGWDREKRNVKVYDPAFEQNSQVCHKYEIGTFLRAWEKSHRLAYVAERR